MIVCVCVCVCVRACVCWALCKNGHWMDFKCTELQATKTCVRSVGSPKCCWRDEVVEQQGATWVKTKDRGSWGSGRGLLFAVEEHRVK